MESYDVFLTGNFVALPAFANEYGEVNPATGAKVIVTKWQSALQCCGPLGALIGVTIAGPITSRIGYRYTFIGALMLLNVFIFVFYYAHTMGVIVASQILEGIPWGIFIANAPAYCSEIVPIKLRAPATQMLQMFWAIGSIIVGAVTYRYNGRLDSSAYKYVLIIIRRACMSFTDSEQQNPHCASMDVSHPARHPHLLCTRVALVASSKGTSRRSSTFGRASWSQVETTEP